MCCVLLFFFYQSWELYFTHTTQSPRWRHIHFQGLRQKGFNLSMNGPIEHVQKHQFPSCLCNSYDVFGQFRSFWRMSLLETLGGSQSERAGTQQHVRYKFFFFLMIFGLYHYLEKKWQRPQQKYLWFKDVLCVSSHSRPVCCLKVVFIFVSQWIKNAFWGIGQFCSSPLLQVQYPGLIMYRIPLTWGSLCFVVVSVATLEFFSAVSYKGYFLLF